MEPLNLKIKDFYSIVNGEIDFTKFSSALITGYYEGNLVKNNGVGKSSCLEAIYWVLFNKARQKKADDVIRWSANEAFVEFDFLFGQKIYKITRRRSRIAKECAVSLFTKENDVWINDSCSTNSETDKKIVSLLKIDDKVFLNSVYFKQHDISLFANANPSERKEIIKSIMKLERWDVYQKQVIDKSKELKNDIEKQQKIIIDNVGLDLQKKVNQENIDLKNKMLLELNKDHKNIQNTLHQLLEIKKERNVNYLIGKLNNVKQSANEEKINGKKLQERQSHLNDIIDTNEKNINYYDNEINNIKTSLNEISDAISSLNKKNILFKELESEILTYKIEKGKIENSIEELNKTSLMVDIGECQICLSEITMEKIPYINKDRSNKKERAEIELLKIIKNLKAVEDEYRVRINNKKQLDELNSKCEVYNTDIVKLNDKKNWLCSEQMALSNEASIIDISIRGIIDRLKAFKVEIESLETKIAEQKIHNVDVEIFNIQEKSNGISDNIVYNNIELGILLKEKEILEQRTLDVIKSGEQLLSFSKEKVSYDQLSRFFGKDGIQAVFIESVVDELEQYANTTLSYICNEPTVIKLKTQKKTGNSWQETLEIDVIMNGYPQTFESLSGGERFRVSLALRIGLSEVLVKRVGGEIKLLILDEVDSPLDTYGLNNLFDNIINGLEKRFKILVVSHNEKIKERFSDVITLIKTNEGSFITQS